MVPLELSIAMGCTTKREAGEDSRARIWRSVCCSLAMVEKSNTGGRPDTKASASMQERATLFERLMWQMVHVDVN